MQDCEHCYGPIAFNGHSIHIEEYLPISVSAASAADFTVCSWSCLAAEAKKRGEANLKARVDAQEQEIADAKASLSEEGKDLYEALRLASNTPTKLRSAKGGA